MYRRRGCVFLYHGVELFHGAGSVIASHTDAFRSRQLFLPHKDGLCDEPLEHLRGKLFMTAGWCQK